MGANENLERLESKTEGAHISKVQSDKITVCTELQSKKQEDGHRLCVRFTKVTKSFIRLKISSKIYLSLYIHTN